MPVPPRAVYLAFQAAIASYLAILVLAMYQHSMDPTGDIKALITAWAAVLLGGGWVVASWRYNIPFYRPRLVSIVVLFFLALLGIATLGSAYFFTSLAELGTFVSLATIYFVATQVYRESDDLRVLLVGICSAVALSSIYGFFQKMGIDFFPWEDKTSDVYTNLPATFGNPNYAAHTLILTIIMAFYLAVTWRPEALIFVIIFATHLVFTDQRAGIIALAAAAGLVGLGALIHRMVRRPVLSALTTIVLAGVLGVVALAAAMTISEQRTGSAFPLDVSLLIRYQSYVSASDMILDAPVRGHGPGVYGIAYPEYWTNFEKEWFAQEGRMNAHVHNDLMELAIDGGLPTAGLYLAMLVLGMAFGLTMAFTPGPRSRRALGYCFAAFFAAFATDGLFGFNLRVPISAALFFVMLGALDGIWSQRPLAATKVARLVAVAMVLVVLGFAVLESRVFAASYQWHEGRRAEAGGSYDAALARYAAGQSYTPWDWNFERRMGHVAIKERDFAVAEEHFQRSLEINPDYFLSHLPLSNVQILLARQHWSDEDQDAMNAALAELDAAQENAEAVLAICPVYATAENVLGRIESVRAVYHQRHLDPAMRELAMADWEAAEKHYLRAIELGAPNAAELYRLTAEVRKVQGDYAGAEEMLVRAAQADPNDGAVWPPFLELAQKFNRHERLANTLYEQIDALRQQDPLDGNALTSLHLMLANVIENGTGDLDAAERAYEAAVEYAPERPELWTNFARFATSHGRQATLEKAIARAVAVAEVADTQALPQLRAVEAVLDADVAALDGASLLLVSTVRSHPRSASLSPELAYGWAANFLNRALAGTDDDTACMAKLNLGIVFASFGQFAQGEELFRRADRCIDDEQRPFLLVHRANGLIELQRETEAVAMLRTAVEENPESFELRMAYARSMAKTGFREEAREQYNLLLAQPELSTPGREMIEREMEQL